MKQTKTLSIFVTNIHFTEVLGVWVKVYSSDMYTAVYASYQNRVKVTFRK